MQQRSPLLGCKTKPASYAHCIVENKKALLEITYNAFERTMCDTEMWLVAFTNKGIVRITTSVTTVKGIAIVLIERYIVTQS